MKIYNDLEISKGEYLNNPCMDRDLWVLRGNLEEKSEEILSVALLSPACSYSNLLQSATFSMSGQQTFGW